MSGRASGGVSTSCRWACKAERLHVTLRFRTGCAEGLKGTSLIWAGEPFAPATRSGGWTVGRPPTRPPPWPEPTKSPLVRLATPFDGDGVPCRARAELGPDGACPPSRSGRLRPRRRRLDLAGPQCRRLPDRAEQGSEATYSTPNPQHSFCSGPPLAGEREASHGTAQSQEEQH